jgi:3-oxoadipate enol-lactonase
MRFRLKSGLAVGYEVCGAGPVVVLLHPIGLRGAFWRPVVELLSTGYRVISIDFRGHGDSDVPGEPFTLEQLADDCLELVRALAAPCVIVGCSMGSAVAQSMCVKGADVVRAAVFANGSGPRTDGRTDALERRAQRAMDGMPAVLADTLERWFSRDFAARRQDVVSRIAAMLLAGDPVVHAWGWRALAGRTDAHDRITMPTMAITGSEDLSATPASVRALVAVLPNSRYVELPGAGHMAVVEQPDGFHRELRAFLQEVGFAPSP